DGPPHGGRRTDRPDWCLGRSEPKAIDELGFLVRPEEQVDGRIATAQVGAIWLTDRAAGQDDAKARPDRLQPGQLALPTDHLLLGALADGAGVDHDQVGRLKTRCLLAAG